MKQLQSPLSVEEYRRFIITFRITAGLTLAVLLIGTVFYHFSEAWSWVDSIYFSVTTLATVGFGDLTPTTDVSKVFTIFYILSGIGLIATFANLAIKRAVIRKPK